MKYIHKQIFIATLLFLCTGILFSINIQAAVHTITNTNNNGTGSLRAAVTAANATIADDIIDFQIPLSDPNCTAQGVCTITLTSGGQLSVSSASTAGNLTISNATGASNLKISGNNAGRVFSVSAGSNLTLSGITLTNGAWSEGGGIYIRDATVTINNSIITNNAVTHNGGGGIYNSIGIITINNSTISGNTSTNNGGGINNNVSGKLNLNNSTVSGNSATNSSGGIGAGIINVGTATLTNSIVSGNNAAGGGGGMDSFGGTTTITNSTISGNTSTNGGGGIRVSGASTIVTMRNSTITGNTAGNTPSGGGAGGIENLGATLNLIHVTVTDNRSIFTSTCSTCAVGGIYNSNTGTTNLSNTIVAGNTAASASNPPDFRGAVSASSSFNLIGNDQGMTGITDGANGNQIGTSLDPIDPRLDTLTNNGGTTQTHALLSDSPAIDKGSSFSVAVDQRGLTRPVDLPSYSNAAGGDGADIGAFELQDPSQTFYNISGVVA